MQNVSRVSYILTVTQHGKQFSIFYSELVKLLFKYIVNCFAFKYCLENIALSVNGLYKVLQLNNIEKYQCSIILTYSFLTRRSMYSVDFENI